MGSQIMPYYFFYQNIMSYHNALQFPSRQRMVDCMDEERFIRRNFIRIESCNSTESFLQHIHPIVLCEGCDDRLPWRISENGCFMAKVFLQILKFGTWEPSCLFPAEGVCYSMAPFKVSFRLHVGLAFLLRR